MSVEIKDQKRGDGGGVLTLLQTEIEFGTVQHRKKNNINQGDRWEM